MVLRRTGRLGSDSQDVEDRTGDPWVGLVRGFITHRSSPCYTAARVATANVVQCGGGKLSWVKILLLDLGAVRGDLGHTVGSACSKARRIMRRTEFETLPYATERIGRVTWPSRPHLRSKVENNTLRRVQCRKLVSHRTQPDSRARGKKTRF